MKNFKIVIFCNKKKYKVLCVKKKKSTILSHWNKHINKPKPRFVKEFGRIRNNSRIYEIVLIYPLTIDTRKTWVKDSLGRTQEAVLGDTGYYIKKILPYWVEEIIYYSKTKKHVKYDFLLDYVLSINDIAQIFLLNNKIFVQNENNICFFGNKNLQDAERLFNLLREDVLNNGKGNFLFVKDISTHQRTNLYKLLTEKGYKWSELVRHYSY